MADAKYDVVLIGGGNKGLVLAMYLAKYGGMKVGIFEKNHELGGGWGYIFPGKTQSAECSRPVRPLRRVREVHWRRFEQHSSRYC